jgi:putative ABC transport system substrate-binding protein
VRPRALALCLAAIAIAAAAGAGAQTAGPALPRVVVIASGDETFFGPLGERLLQGLRDLGHAEGKTLRLEIRYARSEPARAVALIQEAVASRPDVLVVSGLTNARRARDATKTVPVVVATSSDLVDAGLAASYARPGGNLTGIADLADEVAVKRLELLKEMMPKLSRLALLNNPDFPATPKVERRVGAAAGPLGITVLPLYARDRASLTAALESLEKVRPGALLVGGDALFNTEARQIIERATARRVPVAHYWPGTAEMGALLSHGADFHKNFERSAYYIDRILKGANPGELPIEQPTGYALVVNRKVATAFGITVPPGVVLRASRLIE